MTQRRGDPDVLQRVPANVAILERLREGAERMRDGVGPWSPDGWVLRTHPDLTEVIERFAPDDLRHVYGIATLIDAAGCIYAVGQGTGSVWLRIGDPRATSAAPASAAPVEGLPGWARVGAWEGGLDEAMQAVTGGTQSGSHDA